MDKLEYIPGDLVISKTEPNNHLPKGGVCEFVSYCNRNKVFVRVAKGIDTFFLKKRADYSHPSNSRDSIEEWVGT